MPGGLELGLELGLEDLREDVLEPAVVALEDRVLGRQVHRVVAVAGRSASRPGRSRGSSRPGCTSPARRRRRGSRRRSSSIGSPPSFGVKVRVSVPSPGTFRSVARYWSPNAWRPITIGLVQPGTSRGTLRMMIGSRKITPPRMLRMVPFGDFHIFFRPNSSTRASSGVIVAHLTPTPCCLIAFGGVDGDLVVGGVAVLDAEVVVLQVDVEVRQDQRVLDELPDDPGHLVAVEFDDGPWPP